MLESLIERFRRGDRLALSRLLSLAAQGDKLPEILAKPQAAAEHASRVVAITGSGGVGKSTLIGKLLELLRRREQRIAVLACDPQSPVSGGALLGDRFRMASQVDDEGVFIRSLAAAPGHGALADHLEPMIRLLEGYGFHSIVIETAGAGQGDTDVVDLADIVVLLLQPEAGDDLQWEKAGLLEVADIVVVNKGDLPRAEQVEAQVRSMLRLSEGRDVSILRVSAKTGDGIDKLWSAIEAIPAKHRTAHHDGRSLVRHAQEYLATWYAKAYQEKQPELMRLVEEWERAGESQGNIIGKLLLLAKGDTNTSNQCRR
jgi:LAO/AO transport system ATPase